MNWKEKYLDLGAIRQNSKQELKFEAVDKNLKVHSISPGCSECTTIKGFENGILTAIFRPGSLPVHLQRNPGYQDMRKIIVITYEDGSKDILSFAAKLIK